MLNKIYWEIPGRVIVTEFAGTVSAENLQDACEAVKQLIHLRGQAPHVHIVVDVSKRTQTTNAELFSPETICDVQADLKQNALAGWLIVIDPHTKRFERWLRRRSGRSVNYLVCASMHEALDFLLREDKTLLVPA